MEILGLEKVSLVDYVGNVCATIFTGGCNFLCPFCHNSGLVKRELKAFDNVEVLEYLNERRKLLDAVTISGGEPTLQPDLESFIAKIKGMGYKVKLDTNGSMPEVLKNLLDKKLVDYVAMDIKNDFEHYSKITGLKKAPIERVKQSLQILRDSGVDYELRTTLVNEFHKEGNIQKMAEELAGEKIIYLQKFVDSGGLIDGEGLSAVGSEQAKNFQKILRKTISRVELRGY